MATPATPNTGTTLPHVAAELSTALDSGLSTGTGRCRSPSQPMVGCTKTMKRIMKNKLKDRAIRFFYHNAGYSYMPGKETREQGRLNCAIAHANAEAHACAHGAIYKWLPDRYSDRAGDMGCIMYVDGQVVASLWEIDLSDDIQERHRYMRVIQAELAIEWIAKR